MKVRLTVEVLDTDGDEPEEVIAEGRIVGDLDLGAKPEEKIHPILTVRMNNILARVQEQILSDSNE